MRMSRNNAAANAAALNPTSVPFFPGGNGYRDEDFELSPNSFDAHSATYDDAQAPNDVRSSRSPASFLQHSRDGAPSRLDGRHSRNALEDSQAVPVIRQVFATQPNVETHPQRESSWSANIDTFHDTGRRGSMVDEGIGPSPLEPFRDPFLGSQATARPRDRFMSFQGTPFAPSRNTSYHSYNSIPESVDEGWEYSGSAESEAPPSRPRMGSEPFLGGILTRQRDRQNGQNGNANLSASHGSRASSFNNQPNVSYNHGTNGYNSSISPVSSLESAGPNSSVDHLSFDEQLIRSPVMKDLLDRLSRCESSTRVIQRDLGDVHRKVDMLLERVTASPAASSAPEFNDPFSTSSSTTALASRGSFSVNVPPHQVAPEGNMNSIDQRLNNLASSVTQLLALQTHSMNLGSNLTGVAAINAGVQALEVSPQMSSPPSATMLRGMTTRGPNAMPTSSTQLNRGWSVGNLDLPRNRNGGDGSPNTTPNSRTESLMPGNSRRSVMGLTRQPNNASFSPLPTTNEAWPSPSTVAVSPRGDNIALLSKWDQLSLSPSLLSSLSKFGVGPPNKIQQRALPFLLRGADIIAQAPPTQERIAAYIIPAIQVVLNITGGSREPPHGPYVVIVSTTVDQATQAQRMIRDLGGPIGVRSALGVGAATSDLSRDLGLLMQNMPHIICGTPQKLHALFTHANGLPGGEVRFLVLDEVDQLIARNIHEYVFNIVKLLPPARRGPQASPLLNSDLSPFETQPSKANSNSSNSDHGDAQGIERQTALFSNTVPQDVLNLASAIQLREPVRVIVRRDGTGSQTESGGGTKGLKQFYIYLAFTASGRAESSPSAGAGPGAIGSGRGSTNAETRQAQEWKLDALGDLFQDVDVAAAIVYVGGMKSLDAVTAKLQTRGVEAVPVHGDLNATAKMAAIARFRGPPTMHMRQNPIKVLVVYDVQLKSAEVSQIPLIINYDLPKAVEEYAHRVAPAIASNFSRPGVVVNFVTATGGDVEMLRSIECYYKIKFPEAPATLRDVF